MPTPEIRSRARIANAGAVLFLCLLLTAVTRTDAQPPPPPGGLPPVPVPAENPITEAKRVLGKILFWDEQLSSDNTMACGTCHRPTDGGADLRLAIHPGRDGITPSPDDVFGSPGVARQDAAGTPIDDPTFGLAVQVTSRNSPSFLTAQFAPALFWDGRAGTSFADPETGALLIAVRGALENQAVGPILSDVEMAHVGRTWNDVRAKLESVTPLALAINIPADMQAALSASPTYPALFAAAFGDPAISAARIAFAIATYERTLVADRTPFDAFIAGVQGALTPNQVNGFNVFRTGGCAVCHGGPLFSDNTFRNIGLRPIVEDIGRQGVTGAPQDAGRFKVPSLRNAGLKSRFMHNGRLSTLQEVLDFYLERNGQQQFDVNKDPAINNLAIPPGAVANVIDFIQNGLTDPRVAIGAFPFDRPTLASEGLVDAPPAAAPVVLLRVHPAYPNPFNPQTTLRYTLSRPAHMTLRILEPRGRAVRTLVRAHQDAGDYTVPWDGTDERGRRVASGVYFYQVDAGDAAETHRLVLVK